jgi:DNA-binding transcriptional LysR family regulator
MDSHAIRCFQRVFEKESIHQAAKDLCMTPQGVSRVISALDWGYWAALDI